MSDDLAIGGKNFVSSKKAAEITGYAQDYIGQLARGGQIEAQRVGGLWYVYLDSLTGYKTRSADFKPQAPVQVPTNDPESVVSFDGKDYVSASRAAKITGYNQDYIGQLARGGKILSRQIGNRWYVDRTGLIRHKAEKDSLLAAVQSESVGLQRPSEALKSSTSSAQSRSYTMPINNQRPATVNLERAGDYAGAGPMLTYFNEEKRDLMPIAREREALPPAKVSSERPLPIRKIQSVRQYDAPIPLPYVKSDIMPYKSAGKPFLKAGSNALMALTIVVVLSYGLVSIKNSSTYAEGAKNLENTSASKNYLASAGEAADRLGAFIEPLLAKELVYIRRGSN